MIGISTEGDGGERMERGQIVSSGSTRNEAQVLIVE